jgi:hypothetical protein
VEVRSAIALAPWSADPMDPRTAYPLVCHVAAWTGEPMVCASGVLAGDNSDECWDGSMVVLKAIPMALKTELSKGPLT